LQDTTALEGDDGDLEDEIPESPYTEYKPRKFLLGQSHPDVLVETASLSATDLPDIHYMLALPVNLINGGDLSAPQLETVAYCCQVHEEWLPYHQTTSRALSKLTTDSEGQISSPLRKGFFLGDGAGVGKGRQLAGIIYENWLQGRHRHIWVSVSADLHLEARKDLDDIGANAVACHRNVTLEGSRLYQGNGVVFSTYSGLISSSRPGGRARPVRRLDLLVRWCGGASFDGCIMLDECHKAKNLVPSRSGLKPTRMGLAVKELQELLPRARVVYCSATGCSEPANMAYMARLGLWGPNTSFPDGFDSFRSSFEQGGVGMM
jgi:hypothetical protein